MWDPRTRPFREWASYSDSDDTHTETYYSMFQCLPLEWKGMFLITRCDISIFADGAMRPESQSNWRKPAKKGRRT